MSDLLGDRLELDPPLPMAEALNRSEFTKDDLSDAAYVAMAGFVKNGIHGQIQDAVKTKFPDLAEPPQIPPSGPDGIVAYALLLKVLQFELPFQRIPRPLRFGGQDVPSFGLGDASHDKLRQLREQAIIWDYQDPNDFVIELKTRSANDRLILAKVVPESTLADTIVAVRRRTAAGPPQKARLGDRLEVPRMNFDLRRRFEQLLKREVSAASLDADTSLPITTAYQSIRFQLDEQGVYLRSAAHIGIGCSGTPSPPHLMVFDRPFLLLLQEADADTPYFALWVANPELLVTSEQPRK